MRSSPPLIGETAAIIRIVLDLPAPLGPRNPNASPRCTSTSIPLTASNSAPGKPNVLRRPRAEIIGAAASVTRSTLQMFTDSAHSRPRGGGLYLYGGAPDDVRVSSEDPGPAEPQQAPSSLWATGDYCRFSDLILAQGVRLVEWSGLGAGDRVLDVAAGTGAASLPAAAAGARVTATDLTPELLEIGKQRARERSLDLEWGTADAGALPFADASYDVVMSAIGAMFAPDQQATADELVRVCRPGGTIAMANWTPGGVAGRFFDVRAPYVPPPPPGPSPTDWGKPDHVAALFGARVTDLVTERDGVTLDFAGSPEELAALYLSSFPPLVTAVAGLDREQRAARSRAT